MVGVASLKIYVFGLCPLSEILNPLEFLEGEGH